MSKVRKNFKGYPGDSYRLAICDLCGAKRHIKDMKLIDADFNRFNGAFMCREHKRPTHPQDIPFVVEPEIIQNPEYIRSRNFPVRMQEVNDSNILPTAPRELRAILGPMGTNIQLNWLGPLNTGSRPIIGYRIEISVPQFVSYGVLVANTNNSAPQYFDYVTPTTTLCTYRVAAISELGMSPYSNDAPYPVVVDDMYLNYVAEDNGTVLMTDDGYYIIEG